MSLNSILNTSLTGIFTNQENLRVTAANVANVNTEGYKRLEVDQQASVLSGQTVGVEISGIRAVIDDFLDAATRSAISSQEEFNIASEFQDRFQGFLGAPDSESSMVARLDRVYNAMADLALSPSDSLRRQSLLSEMESFFGLIDSTQGVLQDLRADASNQIEQKLADANQSIDRIHELNKLLVRQTALGGETGGLEGQMSVALDQLAGLIDIRIDRQSSGGVTVYTGSGQVLTDLNSNNVLVYNSPSIVSSETRFDSIQIFRRDELTGEPTGTGRDFEIHMRSGELRGLVDLRDGDLRELTQTIGELAAQVMDELNRAHNSFTAVPPPNSLTGTAVPLLGTSPPNFTGVVTFAVTDANLNLVKSITIDFDAAPPENMTALVAQVNTGLTGAGSMSLTNGVLSLQATNATNGVVVADDPTNPTDRGGRNLSHYFGLNNLVVSESQGVFNTGVVGSDLTNFAGGSFITISVRDAANREIDVVTAPRGVSYDAQMDILNNAGGLGKYFTFTLDSQGAVSVSGTPQFSGLSLAVVAETLEYGTSGLTFSQAFGLGDKYQANAAVNIRVKEDIANDPDRLSLAAFNLDALVGEVALSSGDQAGALALQRVETLLVDFKKAGEIGVTSDTLSDYVGRFLGNSGLMARRAENQKQDNQALQLELNQRRQDVSGVNMDEELANLVVFQNAYNAAARILSSVQELYDSLFAAV